MLSFTDYYNAISIDRLPSKTKIGKDSLYFNNSLLCNPEVSSATKTFLFLLKTHKKNKCGCSGLPVGPQHLKVDVADWDFPNCFYVINRTSQYLMLIM